MNTKIEVYIPVPNGSWGQLTVMDLKLLKGANLLLKKGFLTLMHKSKFSEGHNAAQFLSRCGILKDIWQHHSATLWIHH